MIGIYKITNLIDGKAYIGQSLNIEERFVEHRHHHSENAYNIGKAIYKYGKENFSFEVLEECSPDKLDELEDYYILKYDTINNGYNNIRGGKNCAGASNANAKLSEQDVYEIREAFKRKEDPYKIYKQYEQKVSYETFRRVWTGRGWSNVHMDVYTEKDLELKQGFTKEAAKINIKISDSEIYDIRESFGKLENVQQVYEKYKEKISESYFRKIWVGYIKPEIHSDVYTKENKDIQRKQSISVGSQNNLFSDEDVMMYRRMYINGTSIKDIHEMVESSGTHCLYNTVYDMIKGNQYKRLPKPAFKFKNKK